MFSTLISKEQLMSRKVDEISLSLEHSSFLVITKGLVVPNGYKTLWIILQMKVCKKREKFICCFDSNATEFRAALEAPFKVKKFV
uniref:STAS domain-containing protein n=1 Tax=Steinernema glaseri TaxID=37863 RepID=A0A1I7YGV6_9BILA